MDVKNITKGKWLIFYKDYGFDITSESRKICIKTSTTLIDPECEANAELIAEAGNVANETGLSPRQLLEHLKAIIDAQFNTGTTLSGLNGTISNAREAITKV